MSKKSKLKVPEASGVIVGGAFLIVTFIMIPLSFKDYLIPMSNASEVRSSSADFPHKEFAQVFTSAKINTVEITAYNSIKGNFGQRYSVLGHPDSRRIFPMDFLFFPSTFWQ